jgi:16S rRNA G527 N7-methylase RsmG
MAMTGQADGTLFKAIGRRVGIALSAEQLARLQQYQGFLASEAVVAGGIGPGELDRLGDRHIADSMMFLTGIPDSAGSLVDIGSGVGLPGIPVAICRPDLSVTLVDRSRKRTDLAGRAVRILGLENVEVVTQDALTLSGTHDVAAFRASLPIERAADFVADRRNGVVGLVGVSRLPDQPDIPEPPAGMDFRLTEESNGMLDSPFWLLRMTFA